VEYGEHAPEPNDRVRDFSLSPDVLNSTVLVLAEIHGLDGDLTWPAEEQGVAVGVAKLEAAEAVVGVLKGLAEGYGALGELGGEGIGVFDIYECVEAQVGMAGGVWHGRDAAFGFEKDLCGVAAYDGEEGVLGRVLKARFEAELVAVEGDGLRDVADDEGWGDMAEFGTSHLG